MTKEDKELLLKDLCARLPYGVMCDRLGKPRLMTSVGIGVIGTVVLQAENGYVSQEYAIEDIKPYLRPMSNMTDEENTEYISICKSMFGETSYLSHPYSPTDFCYEHCLDCRGLIPRGLALEASEGMYKFD